VVDDRTASHRVCDQRARAETPVGWGRGSGLETVVPLERHGRSEVSAADVCVLAGLDDSSFERVAVSNAFMTTRDADVWARLLSTGLIARTYDVLRRVLHRNVAASRRRKAEWEQFRTRVAAQPGSQRRFVTARREYERRRRKAANFSAAIQNAITEVNRARKRINMEAHGGDEGRSPVFYRTRLRELAVAVHRHRAAVAEGDVIAEPHDLELWQTLETITVPHGPASQPTSLLTMIRQSHWS
jgi:hypothetical protein